MWLSAARERAKEHPAEAVPVLLRQTERILEGGDRRAYRHAAGVLRETRRRAERAGGLDEVDQHIHRPRERNRRRPALQDEFTKAGLPVG